MNNAKMSTYVEFVADKLSKSLGCPPIYGVSNPFEWMDMISLGGKTNFFEKRVSDYQKSGVMDKVRKREEEGGCKAGQEELRDGKLDFNAHF